MNRMTQVCGVVCLLLCLLLPLSALQSYTGTMYIGLPRNEEDTLTLLRSLKRRVSNQLKLQESSRITGYDYKKNNIRALAAAKRSQSHKDCRRWNDSCVPWSSEAKEVCCDPRGLVCHCNLWIQNCRCVSRAWGK